jgi:hypothetical protein
MDLLVPTAYDLTGHTALKLHFSKPNGTTVTKVGADGVTNNGSDAIGTLKYTIVSGDLDIEGTYTVVPEVTKSGKVLKGYPAVTFEVVGDFA